MKKTKILVALLLAVIMVMAIGLTACQKHECSHKCPICGGCLDPDCKEEACATKCNDGTDLSYADNTELRVAAGYNNLNTAISFKDSMIVGEGVTLSDGVTYHLNDLKPTWKQISDDMKIKFSDIYQGNSAANEYQYWIEGNKTSEVDIVSGTATKLQEGGVAGKLVNLANYLDRMPNFKAYLDANPIVRLSITGDTATGAIYFSPYFDGVDDIERFPLIRADLVTKLLDGTTAFTGKNRTVTTGLYTPYMPTVGTVVVESLNATGTAKENITKDYSKYGNIVKKMNETANLTGDQAVAMLRDYIDKTYNNLYGEKRSDLFLGYNAAWDADELVALLRCAVASFNQDSADGTESETAIAGLFSRETLNTQREVDLFRFAGSLFGVRGMESRQDYLYFDKDGELHDARQEADAYDAVMRINAMNKEGLVDVTNELKSEARLNSDGGLVSYDYSQTQTIYNNTSLNDGANAYNKQDTGEKYTPIMVPVASWNDGTGAKYFRFTESWRSVKTEGWGIVVDGVKGANHDKLNAALALIDFAFSVQGQITMSYGSDDFMNVKPGQENTVVKTWADVATKYVTFNFNGQEWPVISDGCASDLTKYEKGNYTNFARRYLGSTLNGFPKSQAFEYQCTHEVGKEGAGKVSAAIGLGIVKHPVLSVNTANMWYTSVPTTLPHTTRENNAINGFADLGNTRWSSSSGKNINVFIEIIKTGFANAQFEGLNVTTSAAAANVVKTSWSGEAYLAHKQAAWDRLLDFYNSTVK